MAGGKEEGVKDGESGENSWDCQEKWFIFGVTGEGVGAVACICHRVAVGFGVGIGDIVGGTGVVVVVSGVGDGMVLVVVVEVEVMFGVVGEAGVELAAGLGGELASAP